MFGKPNLNSCHTLFSCMTCAVAQIYCYKEYIQARIILKIIPSGTKASNVSTLLFVCLFGSGESGAEARSKLGAKQTTAEAHMSRPKLTLSYTNDSICDS